MSTLFATPGAGGFNRRGAHPDGGHYYGGCETALCELVRGGDMVLREVMYHDDASGKCVLAPILDSSSWSIAPEIRGIGSACGAGFCSMVR
jgi:hypothetical protein